jgi:hypothetical protein
VQAPKANAIAERLVGTLRRECLDPHDRCERAAPVQGLAGVRSPLQPRATSPLTGLRDSNGAPGSRWATGNRQDRCPARAWWPPSRVRVGGHLSCVDTDEILGPHKVLGALQRLGGHLSDLLDRQSQHIPERAPDFLRSI